MSNTRATRPNPALVLPTGNPERILREQKLSFCAEFGGEVPEHNSDDKDEPIHAPNHAF